MKKGTLVVLFGSLLLLGACSSKKEASTSNTTIKSSTTTEKKASSQTRTTTVQESTSSSSTQNSSGVLETSQSSEPLDTTFTEENAIETLKEFFASKGFSNDNAKFIPINKVGEDYVIKLVDLSMVEQGGSGSVGFYRVSPQGVVEETDSSGNPY